MNKEIELEAQKYTESKQWANNSPTNWVQNIFIAGATSTFVEKQKLEFAIEQLKSLGQVHSEKAMSQRTKFRIKQLEEQIQQLENGTTNT